MSKTFAVNVTVRDKRGFLVKFRAGEAVPEWAEGLVGDHCVAGGGMSTPADDAVKVAGPAEGEQPKPTDGPDFTKPAPRRGRPRKQG